MPIVWFIIGITQTGSLFARQTNQLGFHLNLTQTAYYDETVSFRRYCHTGIHPLEIRFQHQGRSSRQTVSLYYHTGRLKPVDSGQNSLLDFIDFSTVRLELHYERKCKDLLTGRLELWAGGGAQSSCDWGEREFQKAYSDSYSAETMVLHYLTGWVNTACTYRISANARLNARAGIPVFSLHPHIYNSRLSVSEHPTVLRSWSHFSGLQAELAWAWSHRRWIFQTYYRFDYTRSHDPYLKKRLLNGLGTGVNYAF